MIISFRSINKILTAKITILAKILENLYNEINKKRAHALTCTLM